MLRCCVNLKAIGYESTTLNGIVGDKSYRVIVALYDESCLIELLLGNILIAKLRGALPVLK